MASRGEINKKEIQPILSEKWDVIPFVSSIENIGTFPKVKTSDCFEEGTYPVVDQSEKDITGYINNEELLYKSDLPIIIFGDHTRNIKYVDFPFAAGADGTKILHTTSILDSKFFYYYLKSLQIPNLGYSRHYSILKQLDVPVPSLNEQKQIAEKLDKLFDQIETIKEASNKIPELLKNFRQQVLTYAVTGKLTEEWRKERQLDEWHTELAKDCCEKVQSGGTPKGGQFALSGIPFLKVYNIVGNKIDFESEPQYVSEEIQNSQIKKSITYPGDVIMNIVGPPLNKVAIIPDTYKEWNINQAITLFRPKEYLNNQYLYYFFCEGSSVNSVLDKTRGVVGQVNISLSQCRDFAISIPPMEEQLEIVKRVQTLFDILDDVDRRYNVLCEKLEKLPQALLCKAFKGELI